MTRRRPELSDEERSLWELVARTARPLRPRRVEPASEASENDALPKTERSSPEPSAREPAQRPPPAQLPGRIDHKTRSKLSRGTIEIDARVDLHGLTQARAHQRLRRFLEEAQHNGARLVLVITGKGKQEAGLSEGGVLRRGVPAWLESSEFRPLVAGFDEAGRRHGGGGALYVRIRRKRSG